MHAIGEVIVFELGMIIAILIAILVAIPDKFNRRSKAMHGPVAYKGLPKEWR